MIFIRKTNYYMKQRILKITESDLSNIIEESVKLLLNEIGDTKEYQKKLGALQARKVLNADGETYDELFDNQAKEGGEIYNHAKKQREKTGKDSDEFGNTINPLYKEYCNGYIEYLNSHPEEQFKRNERLRKLGYPNV